jgi:hypothetical protein
MSQPWLKFYPSDWRADPALRVCSIGARGLWMEMLCIMHEAVPRGSLLVNGRPVTDRQLANLCGVPLRDAAALLSELDEAGVFSRDTDGTIFSRRIRRDHAKAEEGRKQVSKRWSGGPENGPDPNRSPNRSDPPDPITQKPEARSQKEDENARAGAARVEIATEILESKGLPADAVEAIGLHHQVQSWLNQGIPRDFIIATSVRVIAKLSRFPDLKYLITAMSNEWQRACEQPAPTAGKPSHATSPRRNGITAAIDGLVERLEAEAGEGGEIRQAPAGLLPDGRRH